MKQFLSLNLALIACFFTFLAADESITVQKMPSGEILLQKNPRATFPSFTNDLKIEVLSLSPDHISMGIPKIEIHPRANEEAPRLISAMNPQLQTFLQKITQDPIQITIQNGKAKIKWSGGEEEIALDSQGRFNLQLQP